MKFRSDFVTNSSSSSFISCGVLSHELAEFILELLGGKTKSVAQRQVGALHVMGDVVSVTTTLSGGDYDIISGMEDDDDLRTPEEKESDNKKANTPRQLAATMSDFLPYLSSAQERRLLQLLKDAVQNGNTRAEVYVDATDSFEFRDYSAWEFRAEPPTPQAPAEPEEDLLTCREKWLRSYGYLVTKDPQVQFRGKRFAFTGFGHHAEKEDPIVMQTLELGGQHRGNISGLVDYLVVDPSAAGEYKIKAVMEQRAKGKNIQVILLEDMQKALERAFAGETPEEPQPVAPPPAKKTKASQPAGSKPKTVTAPPPETGPFRLTDNGKTLSKYLGTDSTVTVPEGITRIEAFAFDETFVTEVILPDTVESIGMYAFSECKLLRQLQLPGSVTSVGPYVFSGCAGLTRFTWPATAGAVPNSAFSKCIGLEELVIEEGVREMGDSVCSYCDCLKNVYLPMSLEKIGSYFLLLSGKPTLHVYAGSWAERYAKENNYPATIMLTPEQEAEQKRQKEAEARRRRETQERRRREAEEKRKREAEEAEKKRKAEAEEAEKKRKLEAEVEERIRRAMEELERKRQAELAEKRARYDAIMAAIALQNRIIAENKGWFGAQAKARQAAQQQMLALQEQLTREFPTGRP